MFDWVQNHKRLIQLLLALITLPFAFFGVESYRALNDSAGEVASVAGQKISAQDFSNQLRQQQDRLRGMLGNNVDASMLDTPEMREQVLDGMIAQRLLADQAVKANLTVSDERMREVISGIPAFQQNGKFSSAQYQAMLQGQGMTPAMFEAGLRRDLMMQQLSSALGEGAITPRATANRLAAVHAQQREVSEWLIRSASFAGQSKPTEEAIKAFYDENKARFSTPEQMRVEYVVLNAEALAAEAVSPEDVKKVYEGNPERFGQPEQRQASHILLTFKPGASDADKAKLLDKAKQLAEQARKSPGSFAELAKKNSEDPGSAAKGGDLGYFSRGMMVKPFEDAAFGMKVGEISDPVQSEFGYHVIRLTGIQPAKMKSLDDVRPEIEAELKKQNAGRRFAEAADTFSNLVYEQPDSLKPAAEHFKLTVRQSPGWVTRDNAADPTLKNPKVLQALFSDDVVKNHRNTEAIEISPGTLIAARALEYKPAALRPLPEVKAEVTTQLVARQARQAAAKEGEAKLAALRKGDNAGAGFGPGKLFSLDKPEGLRPDAAEPVFRADVSKLPAYVGVEVPEGYAIYRIGKVVEAQPDSVQQANMQQQLTRLNGSQEFRAYVAALRANGKVLVNKDALQDKQATQ